MQKLETLQFSNASNEEIEAFWKVFTRFCIKNIQGNRGEVQLAKLFYYQVHRSKYPKFYYKKLKHLDFVYQRKQEAFLSLVKPELFIF